jgi:hypothetical protein
MSLTHCTDEARKIIGQCLSAAAEGPFFPEWEFETLFGLTRSEVAEISKVWPKVDERDAGVDLAVNNALGNLAGYPHGQESIWDEFISVPPCRLLEVLELWRLV